MEYSNHVSGQTTVEFLLVLLIALIYLQAVVQPGIDKSVGNLNDAQRITQAKIEAQKLANAIEEISLISGSAKKELILFLPKKTELNLQASNQVIEVSVKELDQPFSSNWTYAECEKQGCKFNVSYYKAVNLKNSLNMQNNEDKTKTALLSIEKICKTYCELNVVEK